MATRCVSLGIDRKSGDNNTLIFKWWFRLPHTEIDHFEVAPYYTNPKSSTWLADGIKKVDTTFTLSDGSYYTEYKVPSPAVAKSIYFCVIAIPRKMSYEEWDGSVIEYYPWDGEWEASGSVISPRWSEFSSALVYGRSNGEKFLKAARTDKKEGQQREADASRGSATTPSGKRNAANLYKNASYSWARAAKNADSASKAYAEAIKAAKSLGESTTDLERAKTEADEIKSEASTHQKADEREQQRLLNEADSQDQKETAAKAKKRQRDSMAGKASSKWNEGRNSASSADSYFKLQKYNSAVSLYQLAASHFDDAAYWYGEAVSYSTDDDDKRTLNQKKSEANEWKTTYQNKAKQCEAYIKAAVELEEEQAETPSAPSVSYTQASTSICLDINCSAKWSTELRIYRDVDGKGLWPLVHTIKRVLPKKYNEETGRQDYEGSVWFQQRWYDKDITDGHGYRYTVRAANMDGKVSDHSGMSDSFYSKPTRPEDLDLSLEGYDEDGKANIKVTWRNTSNVADTIEVQYSTWFGTGNAWVENALDKITTVNTYTAQSTSYTLTGMEPGKKLYVRVRAVNGQGGAWAYIKGGKEKGYGTAVIDIPAIPEPKLNEPSALKATVSNRSVILNWTDKLEEGANYSIEYTHNRDAWKNNAVGDITILQYTDTSGGQASSSTKTYTITNLEPGQYFIRVAKVKDATKIFSTVATGASKADDTMCVIEIAAQSSSIPAPQTFRATKYSDTSVLLTWVDTEQQSGESYEIQYADYMSAFQDNAVGDIKTATNEELTAIETKRMVITSLDRGRTWYFRSRKKTTEGVSQWSAVASAKLEGETIRRPTGLKAKQVTGDPTRINVTWTDAPEEGVTYTMRIAPSLRAFTNNAISEITEYQYNPSQSTADVLCQYEFTALEPGTTYYIQAVKVKGTLTQRATAASGNSKADEYTAFLQLPEQPTPSISIPTNLTAVPRTAEGVIIAEDGYKAAAKVSWTDEWESGYTYEISYTDDSEAFADNAIGYIQSLEYEGAEGSNHSVAVTGLDRGKTWYFRCRKKTTENQGRWSETAECFLEAEPEPAEQLAPPTVTDTLQSYSADETIDMVWIHNSAQGSVQSGFQLEITITEPSGAPVTRVVEATTSDNLFIFDLQQWSVSADGTKIEWRVRTSGAQPDTFSPWSRTQVFKVFARPSSYTSVPSEIQSFPIPIEVHAAVPGGGSLTDENAPIAYTVEILAGESYDYDQDGTIRHASEGEVLFTRSIDVRDPQFSPDGWTCEVYAQDVRIVGGRTYIAKGVVTTAQGMRAESDATFQVFWSEEIIQPFCTLIPDRRNYTMTIAPFCGTIAEEEEGETPELPDYEPITPDEKDAMSDFENQDITWDYASAYVDPPAASVIQSRTIEDLRPNTILSVFRVTSSGVVEIASNLQNDGMIACLDPHPDFGSTTYRIVATDTLTGAQSVYEAQAEMPIDKIVVQWDEQWTEGGVENFNAAYLGKRIELNHNMQTSEAYAYDSALRGYAGRSHPVSYYGTQHGQTATLSGVVIKGYENSTLEAVRMLAAWPGDCYIREPLGTGYWANVRPSVSSTFNTAAIQVNLGVSRVEGGA